MKKILVIDDEISIVKVMKLVLEKRGYAVIDCFGPDEALLKLKTEQFDLMITDLKLNHRVDGLDLVDRVKTLKPKLPIIVMTAYSTVSIAVKAMKLGVYDFITKPFKMDEFLDVIENCLKNSEISAASLSKTQQTSDPHFGSLLGDSAEMQKVYSLIKKVAKTNASVIIEGESGTGKEMVAQAIHQASKRKDQPFHKVNCGAIIDSFVEKEVYGLDHTGEKEYSSIFEEAHNGTIFLDQADKMNSKFQASILRIIEAKKLTKQSKNRQDIDLDFRIISGSNILLKSLVSNGDFCEDLYYKLSVIPIRLPSLRHRVEDIPVLAKHFCVQESKNLGHTVTISTEALESLLHYSWPGNIRELMNVISCAALISDSGEITCNELPPNITELENKHTESDYEDIPLEDQSLKEYLKYKEKTYIDEILRRTNGNRVKAAKLLGISRASLYRKL
jgi:DNA-binding NtrC family response regulator